MLATFPEGSERSHLELGVLTALGPALTAVKGYGAPEVELIYARARTLCEPLGETALGDTHRRCSPSCAAS